MSRHLKVREHPIERCPRCLARRKVAVAMYVSERPSGPAASDGVAPSPSEEARSDCG